MTTPRIIKETCEGTVCVPLHDALFQRREIYCTGEINAETADSIIVQLHFLSIEDPKGEIVLYINSPGGEVSGGLAVYDVMQSIPAPVRTVCAGTAASMAAILFAAGDQREIMPHARVMIHDPLIAGNLSGSARKIDRVARDLMQTRETISAILAKHTGHSLSEVLQKMESDCIFNAADAIAWGLADRIISSF